MYKNIHFNIKFTRYWLLTSLYFIMCQSLMYRHISFKIVDIHIMTKNYYYRYLINDS